MNIFKNVPELAHCKHLQQAGRSLREADERLKEANRHFTMVFNGFIARGTGLLTGVVQASDAQQSAFNEYSQALAILKHYEGGEL